MISTHHPPDAHSSSANEGIRHESVDRFLEAPCDDSTANKVYRVAVFKGLPDVTSDLSQLPTSLPNRIVPGLDAGADMRVPRGVALWRKILPSLKAIRDDVAAMAELDKLTIHEGLKGFQDTATYSIHTLAYNKCCLNTLFNKFSTTQPISTLKDIVLRCEDLWTASQCPCPTKRSKPATVVSQRGKSRRTSLLFARFMKYCLQKVSSSTASQEADLQNLVDRQPKHIELRAVNLWKGILPSLRIIQSNEAAVASLDLRQIDDALNDFWVRLNFSHAYQRGYRVCLDDVFKNFSFVTPTSTLKNLLLCCENLWDAIDNFAPANRLKLDNRPRRCSQMWLFAQFVQYCFAPFFGLSIGKLAMDTRRITWPFLDAVRGNEAAMGWLAQRSVENALDVFVDELGTGKKPGQKIRNKCRASLRNLFTILMPIESSLDQLMLRYEDFLGVIDASMSVEIKKNETRSDVAGFMKYWLDQAKAQINQLPPKQPTASGEGKLSLPESLTAINPLDQYACETPASEWPCEPLFEELGF